MPHRLFEAIRAKDLIWFDELLNELRPGPLDALRDVEGRSLLEAVEDVDFRDAISERLLEHSLGAQGGEDLANYIEGLAERPVSFLNPLWESDRSVGEDDAQMGGGVPEVPYVPTEQEIVAEKAVAALKASPDVEHQNLAAECVCLITKDPFVPSVEALAPIKLPDFPGASGSVISRGAARILLATERDPIYGSQVPPTDPGNRSPLDADAILGSPAFLRGNAQRTAMVNAVLEVFAEPGVVDVAEQCRRAYEAAEVARGLHTANEPVPGDAKTDFLSSPAYRDAAAQAAMGGMREWRAVLAGAGGTAGATAEAGPARSPSGPAPGSLSASL